MSDAKTNDAIKADSLSKVFEKRGQKVHALAGVNLTIPKGDYVALRGPSGSGKTTLLNMIGCLDRPTSGRLFIDGIDVSTMDEKALAALRSRKIGFIFQFFNLIQIFNATENVELPMVNMGISKSERKKKAAQLLAMVGLSGRLTHDPNELSGGEQQRVAIARALANGPSIILADEPTGNLDSKTGEHIMKLLGELNKTLGTTIVVVTHDEKMARLAKRTIRMEDGSIVSTPANAEGAPPSSVIQGNVPGRIIRKTAVPKSDGQEKTAAKTGNSDPNKNSDLNKKPDANKNKEAE